MKKCWLSAIVALMFAFTGCFYTGGGESSSSSGLDIVEHSHIDLDRDGVCDTCTEEIESACVHRDRDNDGICDACHASVSQVHVHADTNSDGICDTCFTTLAPPHEHTDANTDGTCDTCFVSIQITLDFYSINDLHGKFDDTYANIGLDEMTTYLRNAQTVNANTVLLSAGDMWQGSAESNFTKGNIITDWMNDLGFAAMAMGNHEFDWGEDCVEANEKIANFPFLGINIYDRNTGRRVEYCDSSVMIERGGVKIGIIGAIGDCYSDIAEEQVEDIYFKVGSDLTKLVKAESQKLREEGADIVVYSLHDSGSGYGSYYDEQLSNGYVDLVFEGHTHQVVKKTDKYGVWHLQAGGDNGDGLSYARVNVNAVTDEVSVVTAKTVYHSEYKDMADDPIVDSLLDKYADELAKTNETLGYNAAKRNSDSLANFAAQAMYLAGMERWGNEAQYAGKIVLGGGFMSVRSPYYLPVGQVTYGDIYTLFTFDNPIILCKLTGSRLKSQFINSTNSRYFMYYGENKTAVVNSIEDDETYYVIVDTYCANYNFSGMGYLEIVEYYDDAHQVFVRDLLAEFIKDGGMS